MRIVVAAAVAFITCRTAAAEVRCELTVELRGAVVDATVRLPVEASRAAVIALPAGGHLTELSLQGNAALAVHVGQTEHVSDPAVLAADPVLAARRPDGSIGVVVQPGTTGTVVARWTAAATLSDGELQLALPAMDGCSGTLRAVAGPGATIASVRVDDATTRGQSAHFVLGPTPVTLAAQLKLARPAVWIQDEQMGGGVVARATTRVVPSSDALPHVRRALLVIDISRSMKLVGRDRIAKLARAIGAALPSDARIEAITFARKPARVLGAWKPIDAGAIDAIDTAIRTQDNGSDFAGALALAHDALAGEPAVVIAITDGVLGELDPDALASSLGAAQLQAIVIDPPGMTSPTASVLAEAAGKTGGAYTEIGVDELDAPHLASWLAPASLAGGKLVSAGEGTITFELVRAAKGAATGPATPLVGQLALAHSRDSALRAQLFARHPFADDSHELAVLATTGRVARNRRAMVAGGGPYTRMITAEDPPGMFDSVLAAVPSPGVIDRQVLQQLFDLQLQPPAYRCFQRGQIAGGVKYRIELGRGEVTAASLAGLGDAALDGCLLDAAYSLSVPLIDPARDPDDRTIANYPLRFELHADQGVVVAGDADSSSPLDIDAIKPWIVRPKDAATPLGPLRP